MAWEAGGAPIAMVVGAGVSDRVGGCKYAMCVEAPAPMACVPGTPYEAAMGTPLRSELSATPAGAMLSGMVGPATCTDDALPVSIVPIVDCSVGAAGLLIPPPVAA